MPSELVLPATTAATSDREPPEAARHAGTERDEERTLHAQPACLSRIAVRTLTRIVIVPVYEIVRLEAEDNYVRIWADRAYLHKETLTNLVSRLDPREFLRVHRSHAVNLRLVRELHPLTHGEFRIVLANGVELTSGRSFRQAIQRAFGLTRSTLE